MKDKLLRVGIVGCGAIGSSLAKAIVNNFKEDIRLVKIFDIDREKIVRLANNLNNKNILALNLRDLFFASQLVIEATNISSCYEIVSKAITLKKHVMVMSVGGVLEKFSELKELADRKKVKLLIPSGAISGIDGIKASSLVKIKKITLITRKPPSAFKDNLYLLKKKIFPEKLKKEIVIFKGTILEAIKLFPQNINICATLGLAVGNANLIEVKIIISPFIDKNIHQIELESEAGRIVTLCENVTHPDNPKTSFLAVLSAIATLKGFIQSVQIGT